MMKHSPPRLARDDVKSVCVFGGQGDHPGEVSLLRLILPSVKRAAVAAAPPYESPLYAVTLLKQPRRYPIGQAVRNSARYGKQKTQQSTGSADADGLQGELAR